MIFSRTEMLIGKENINKLKNAHIAVFGIGGVGGYVVEALARCGVGTLSLFDNDVVSKSNINRQIIALSSTVGISKTEAAKIRIKDINPNANVICHDEFFMPENSHKYDFSCYDYVIDAIDTVTGKIEIIKKANEANVPVISCMGTGNKLDPSLFKITDIYKTSVCPLAKVMRYELKKRGIKKLKVLYSTENPMKVNLDTEDIPKGKRQVPGSISFVPSVAGLMIAGEVIKDIINSWLYFAYIRHLCDAFFILRLYNQYGKILNIKFD